MTARQQGIERFWIAVNLLRSAVLMRVELYRSSNVTGFDPALKFGFIL